MPAERGDSLFISLLQKKNKTKYFGMPAERDDADISDAGATAVVSPV